VPSARIIAFPGALPAADRKYPANHDSNFGRLQVIAAHARAEDYFDRMERDYARGAKNLRESCNMLRTDSVGLDQR
jgi:hypothetical protein